MSSCVAGRQVVLRFKNSKTGRIRTANLVVPHQWAKKRVLDYCRREHPESTVVIADWKQVGDDADAWETRLWLVNPKELVGQ